MKILRFPDAPVAPAGAPPKPAAPAPAAPAPAAPAPAPKPAESAGGSGDNPFADLDRAFKAGGTDFGDPPVPDKATPKDDPSKAATPAPAAPAKPSTPAPEKKVGAPGELNWNSTPKQFRERKESLEKELGDSKKAMTDLQQKLADYEARGQDTTKLLAQIDSERKEKEELHSQIRMLKQETSPDFKDKYDKPFNQQAQYAQQAVTGITKADGTAFTWDNDFAALYHLPYAAARAKAIEDLGAENAQTVMDEIRDLKKLDFARGQALAEEKKQWAERTKADEAKAAETKARDAKTQKQRSEEFRTLWHKVNTDLEGTVKEYAVPPDDKELNEAKAKGIAIIDAEEKDFSKALPLKAHIRQRAAMFVPNQIQIARLTAEVDRLKKELDDKNPPPPGGGARRPGGHEKVESTETWEEAAIKAIKG